jgi:CubicO group peptidase (beta-lactamase class C family)
MKKTKNVLLLLLIFTFSLAQSVDFKKLDRTIQKALKDYDVPGLSIGIVRYGKLVFSKGYGVKNLETKEKVDKETLFPVASISKAFTAASIAKLVEEKKLTWDDKVIDHLPWFRLHDSYVTEHLRVRDLLSHRIGYNTFDGDLLWYGTSYSVKEVVKRFRNLPAKHEFRTKFGYSNIMFMTAALLIEEVSGLNWFDFVKKNIYKPLKMNASVTSFREYTKDMNFAYPHEFGKVLGLDDYDNFVGAVGVHTNVVDMANWMNMWIEGGKFEGKDFLSSKNVMTILTPHMSFPVGKNKTETHFSAAALGWFVKDYYGKRVLSHGGGLPGFVLDLQIIPEEKLGVLVLANTGTGLSRFLVNHVFNLYLEKSEHDYLREGIERAKKGKKLTEKAKADRLEKRKKHTKTSLKLKEYAGKYEDKMYGTATIKYNRGKLFLSLDPSIKWFKSQMKHWHHDTFEVKFSDGFLPEGYVTFEFTTDGEVSGFKIELPNNDFHFTNLHFIKK